MILVLDNYDSFTYNLVHYIGESGQEVLVVRNDEITIEQINDLNPEKIVISPADIETVTNQITTTWQKIQNREFYKGCGEEDCKWCNFVKTNNLSILSEDAEEEI